MERENNSKRGGVVIIIILIINLCGGPRGLREP